LFFAGGEDKSYFVERLETGGRRFNSCRSLRKLRSSENRTLSTCFPAGPFFVGGEDESYFANLEMQVSIPAAAFAVSSKKGRQE
jgi:hypothetical protein